MRPDRLAPAPVYDPRVSHGTQTAPASAVERVALVADDGSFEEWDADVVSDDPLSFHDTSRTPSASPPRGRRPASARRC